jgi:hypothetical protein
MGRRPGEAWQERAGLLLGRAPAGATKGGAGLPLTTEGQGSPSHGELRG